MGLVQQAAFLAGAFCLGVAAVLGVIVLQVNRHSENGGCLGAALVLFVMGLAGYLLILGLTSA